MVATGYPKIGDESMPDLEATPFLIALRHKVMSAPDPTHDEALRMIAHRRMLLANDIEWSRQTLNCLSDVSSETWGSQLHK